MVNYIPINCPAERASESQNIRLVLENAFKYTKEVNVHALFDFVPPMNTYGAYDKIFFIDIPNEQGNYYRTKDKKYLNSIAIAIRIIEDPNIISVDNQYLYTNKGSFDYMEQAEHDRQLFKRFVFAEMPYVKYMDIVMLYKVLAPNCNKQYQNNCMFCNIPMKGYEAINTAISLRIKPNESGCSCILYKKSDNKSWAPFVEDFIQKTNEYTKEGILTRKKVDILTHATLSKEMTRLYDTVGNKLCIIKGKAGTGKTMALLRVMYNEVKDGENARHHNCRLLTYNNMLVADLKQLLHNIGDFTPTKTSIRTLHGFFFDILKRTPIMDLHMNQERLDEIYALMLARTAEFNGYILKYIRKYNCLQFPSNLLAIYEEYSNEIQHESKKEIENYIHALSKEIKPQINNLHNYALAYATNRFNHLKEHFLRDMFFNDYDRILKEIYLMFHNQDEFSRLIPQQEVTASMRMTKEYETKYQKLYNDFMQNAQKQFVEENVKPEKKLPEYKTLLASYDQEILQDVEQNTAKKHEQIIIESIKQCKRFAHWSNIFLVDEAQDCSIFEKAILYELVGSEHIVIASGGKDQLIRTSNENDWSILYGKRIENESFTLRSRSKRQKGNIVRFLNALARQIKLRFILDEPDNNYGRVIIDCRNSFPTDNIKSLYLSGKDYGCSKIENLLFILPALNIQRTSTNDKKVILDKNYTFEVIEDLQDREMGFQLPEYLNVKDGTVNDKRDFVDTITQSNTRCILYESCRGLEAWNVVCIEIDKFHKFKYHSEDARVYSEQNKDLFGEDLRGEFANLWCYMALTRSMDTLYITLEDVNSSFSNDLLTVARSLPFVEILEGAYKYNVEDSII